MTAPTIHSSVSGAGLTQTISTTVPNTMLIALLTGEGNPVLSLAGAGLTWVKRADFYSTGGYCAVWYAACPGVITSQAITATVTSGSLPFAQMAVYAVAGAGGWDANPSLPAKGDHATVVVSTTAADDLLLYNAYEGGSSNGVPPTGFTYIQRHTASGDWIACAQQALTGTVSSLSVAIGSDCRGMIDALTPGTVTQDGNAPGDTIILTASLIAGTGSAPVVNGNAPGDTIVATASLLAGTATGPDGAASGALMAVTMRIIAVPLVNQQQPLGMVIV
jgi:hypothetical protein